MIPPPDDSLSPDRMRERCLAALQHGGYWRASLRLDGEGAARLRPGRALTSEWRLPRIPADSPLAEAEALFGDGSDVWHIAVVAMEDQQESADTSLALVRIAPGFPEHWQELRVGDQLTERLLGTATLTEYVPPPAE